MGFLKKLFQPTPKEPIIVVSGLPRSGTSMMMKMLEAGGVPPLTDKIREADKDNPKGYYEFERVKQLDKGDTVWLADTKGKVVKIISALLKHLPADYQYRIIFMRRNMSEILASQRKMLVRRGENADDMDDAKMAALFEKHLQGTIHWIDSQSNVSVLYVHYSDMLADPVPQIKRVNAFLGSRLNETAMAEVVDPALYRNRAEEPSAG
ncbi:MAG: sulfotransferase [Ardenticatenaceae bacterium]|nr:sulfotransferase [Ardenticatenaceae bacterium]MCB9445691.1 sulfotransferase [Ardenticatenaceae bacterium]